MVGQTGASACDADGKDATFKRVLNLDRYLDLLDRTEYRKADAGEVIEDVYRLRYRSYLRSKLITPNEEQMTYDHYDDLENCFRFGVYCDGELAATLRFHHVSLSTPWSPSMSVFGDLLMPRLMRGETFIDASRFAVDADWSGANSPMPAITIRLSFMACEHFNTPFAINMIRREHAVYYRRMFGFRQVDKGRNYNGVINVEALLYEGNLRTERNRIYTNFPFYVSTATERKLLFESPSLGINAPLSVLPTARIALRNAA